MGGLEIFQGKDHNLKEQFLKTVDFYKIAQERYLKSLSFLLNQKPPSFWAYFQKYIF